MAAITPSGTSRMRMSATLRSFRCARRSSCERDWQALRSCGAGQVVVAGDQDEFGIERGHGRGEVNGVVAAQLVGLGEVTSVAGQLGGDLDVVDLRDDRL